MRQRTLIQVIASAVQARLNCIESGNSLWHEKWSRLLDYIERNLLPSGSGIDNGTGIDLDKSSGNKVVLTFGYHFMDENGYYDGWEDYTAVVTPTFDGIDVVIKGRNRDDIKDYLAEQFDYVLGRLVEETAEGDVKFCPVVIPV